MKAGWETKRLGDVIVASGTIDPTKTSDRLFRYVDVSSVSNELFEIQETQELLGRDAPSRARRLIKTDDVLFATIRPTLKRIAIVPACLDGQVCSTGYFVFRTKTFLDPRFLFYFLRSDDFIGAMERLQTGASYPAVNDTQVRQQEIRFPPLPEQRRIVSTLDEAFAGLDAMRANAEKNLQNARELFETILADVFTKDNPNWTKKHIAQIATKIGSGATPKGGKESYKAHGLSLIRSMNVHDRRFKCDDLAYLDDEQAEKLSNVVVEKDDVLLNITGASVARCCKVPENVLPARVNQHVSIIRPVQTSILPQFLEYALTTRPNKERLLGVGEKGGSTRQAITKAEIEEFPIAFPAIEAQARLIAELDTIRDETSRLEAIYAQELAAIDELKRSILQKAFAGELTSAAAVAA